MKKATILVTDDDPVVRNILSSILNSSGFKVIEAESGKACLEKIGEGLVPDAIFVDFLMPGMNGVEVLKELRNLDSVKNTPIIMLSANTEEEANKVAKDIKPDFFLEKPFTPDVVANLLKKILSL